MSGGYTQGAYTDTTELYDGSWSYVGKLPWQLSRFTIINIDNRILSFGKHILEKDLLEIV